MNEQKECNEQAQQHYPLPFLPSTLELAPSDSDSPQGTSEAGLAVCQTMREKLDEEIDYKNLYIGNLPISLIGNNLKDIFSGFGKITSVKLAMDKVTGIPQGYGFVRFENSIDANSAMTRMNGLQYDGHTLEVRIAGHPPALESHCNLSEVFSASTHGITTDTLNKPDREINLANLYVCHLPRSMNESGLKQLFSPFGQIIRVKLMRERFAGTSRGFGFVHFRNVNDAAQAVALLNGHKVEGHLLEVRVADRAKGYLSATSHGNLMQGFVVPGQGSPSVGTGSFNRETDAGKLIIFNLPQAVNENGLLELFSPFGKITHAKVTRDHSTGISKGVGFVYFESVIDAQRAVADMNGFFIEGHELKVEIAKPPPVVESSPLYSPSNQLFFRFIPENLDENYLAALFSSVGKITNVQLIRDQSSELKNVCGFVCYENASDAGMAVARLNRFKTEGNVLEVELVACTQPGATRSTHNNTYREFNPAHLFVGRLPITVDENRLMRLFSRFGNIVGVKVVRDHVTGFSSGSGFVNFEDANDAARAVKCMNGLRYEGHALAVRVAHLNS